MRVACPKPFSETVATVVAPSLNVTEPVGVTVDGAFGVTVAVNVTDCPNTVGLCEVVRDVAVVPWATFWVKVPVLVEKLLSSESRRKIGNRPIVRTLDRILRRASRNPFPTMQKYWEMNQGSKYLGKKRGKTKKP